MNNFNPKELIDDIQAKSDGIFDPLFSTNIFLKDIFLQDRHRDLIFSCLNVKISDYIVAFECSHNHGKNDNHLPLVKNAWYWKVLKNKKYNDLPKILEFRHVGITKILQSVKLFS